MAQASRTFTCFSKPIALILYLVDWLKQKGNMTAFSRPLCHRTARPEGRATQGCRAVPVNPLRSVETGHFAQRRPPSLQPAASSVRIPDRSEGPSCRDAGSASRLRNPVLTDAVASVSPRTSLFSSLVQAPGCICRYFSMNCCFYKHGGIEVM